MQTLPNASRDTQLFVHAVASALFQADESGAVLLDLSGVNEPSPAAQKQAVAEHLAAAMSGVEALIRAQKNPPARMSGATAGRRLVQRSEVYDAVNGTYTPGPGLQTLVEALLLDVADQVKQAHR